MLKVKPILWYNLRFGKIGPLVNVQGFLSSHSQTQLQLLCSDLWTAVELVIGQTETSMHTLSEDDSYLMYGRDRASIRNSQNVLRNVLVFNIYIAHQYFQIRFYICCMGYIFVYKCVSLSFIWACVQWEDPLQVGAPTVTLCFCWLRAREAMLFQETLQMRQWLVRCNVTCPDKTWSEVQ